MSADVFRDEDRRAILGMGLDSDLKHQAFDVT